MVLLPESAGRYALASIADIRIVLYPALLTVALTAGTICAALGVRRTGIALTMALMVVSLRQSLFAFVPWATTTEIVLFRAFGVGAVIAAAREIVATGQTCQRDWHAQEAESQQEQSKAEAAQCLNRRRQRCWPSATKSPPGKSNALRMLLKLGASSGTLPIPP